MIPSKKYLFQFGTAFLLTFFLYSNGLFAQPGTPDGGNYPEGVAGVDYNLKNSKNKRDGLWIRVWSNGNLYYKGQFKDGQPTGGFTFFYEDGNIMSEVNHIENGRKSFTKHYRPDGSVQAEGMYVTSNQLDENGEPLRLKQGEWNYFDPNGIKRLVENYNQNTLHGPTETFGSESQSLEKEIYVDGKKDGVWTKRDESGTMIHELNYRNGDFHGFCKQFYPNGRVQSMGSYESGKMNGFWGYFGENGQIEKKIQYELGKVIDEVYVNGTFELTYPDERPKETFTVVEGNRTGTFKEWHDTGKWVIQEELDRKSGETIRKRVLQGTKIKRQGEYKEGKLHGEVLHYDLNGRLHLIETYENGELKSTRKQ
ncbi:MAG: toxin-antitoxin system YwqK family antitoxin [Flavobacteriales bacterium]